MHGRDAQVVEVLRNLSQHEELAEAIDFGRLGVEEVAALGRVLGTLAREERAARFWVDIADQVGCLLLVDASKARISSPAAYGVGAHGDCTCKSADRMGPLRDEPSTRSMAG